jgi:hypothetical protein
MLKRWGLIYGLVGFSLVVLSVPLWAPKPQPHFVPIIEWGDGSLVSGLTNVDVDTELRLMEDGEAWVTEFPQGTMIPLADGTFCLDISTSERYTGPATWIATNQYRLAVVFGDSDVNVSVGYSRMGAQAWSDVRWVECGETRVDWWLHLHCGDSGEKKYFPCPRRLDGS